MSVCAVPHCAVAMSTPLRVLLVEDSEVDAFFILRELQRGGFEPTWERVDTAAGLSAALARQWDLITCDSGMPKFSGPAALQLIQERGLKVPTIVVSGQVGEEFAVGAIKAGARDYISKHKLGRLVPAVERELHEAQNRCGPASRMVMYKYNRQGSQRPTRRRRRRYRQPSGILALATCVLGISVVLTVLVFIRMLAG